MSFKSGLEQPGFVDHNKQFGETEKELGVKKFSGRSHNIQSDVISKQRTDDELILNSGPKKKSMYDKAVLASTAKNIASKKAAAVPSDNRYIYFDETNRKTGKFLNDVLHNGHDKMAVKSTSAMEAGGAEIENYFTDKGKLTLNQGKNRTDRRGFGNKAHKFLDKVEDAFIAANFDENEAAASYADEYVSKKLDKEKRKFVKEARRFSDIKFEANKDIKTAKKDIKKEAKREKKQQKSYVLEERQLFKDSNIKFNEPKDKFFDKYASTFKNETQDTTEKLIFSFPAIKYTIKNNQFKKQDSIKNKKINQKKDISNKQRSVQDDWTPDESKPNSKLQSPGVNKSENSHFTDSASDNLESSETIPNRFITKDEKIEQEKSKKKAANKEKNKQLRRAAAAMALSNVLRAKKETQNELGDMSGSRVTGDFLSDGKGPILATVGNALSLDIQNMARALMKEVTVKLLSLIGAALGACMIPLIIILAGFLLLFVGYADTGEVYDLNLGGDSITYQSLTSEQIDNIIDSLYETYNNPELSICDMGSTQETILRYALSKVGCPYDQGKHWSLTEDIFDCSSLAMRAYREAGINIKNGDAFSAAEECRALENQNKVVGNELIPGDLIFYGGRTNGRYRGIYHVAIYVGNGKMVEARGKKWGVVYGDVRSNNVVICARPFR